MKIPLLSPILTAVQERLRRGMPALSGPDSRRTEQQVQNVSLLVAVVVSLLLLATSTMTCLVALQVGDLTTLGQGQGELMGAFHELCMPDNPRSANLAHFQEAIHKRPPPPPMSLGQLLTPSAPAPSGDPAEGSLDALKLFPASIARVGPPDLSKLPPEAIAMPLPTEAKAPGKPEAPPDDPHPSNRLHGNDEGHPNTVSPEVLLSNGEATAWLKTCVQAFFEWKQPEGLAYLAVGIDPAKGQYQGTRQMSLFFEAGKRLSPEALDLDNRFRGRPFPYNDRLLLMAPPWHTPQRRRLPMAMVFEYYPTRADALRRRAIFSILAGLLGVLAAVGGTLAIRVLARQREEAEKVAREQQHLAMLGRMSAVMAHELRNPLASAKGRAQLLVRLMEDSGSLQERARRVVDEILRVENVTNQLLDFVRSGRVHRQRCDPMQVAKDAAERVQTAVPVEVLGEGLPSHWSLDPYAMERVLINLIRNAAQAQEGSDQPIRVTLQLKAQALWIEVRDHGPGFPPGMELFSPFVTTRSAGTGLGLTVSRQIVLAHGGEIHLSNALEGGAVVELRLPPGEEPATDRAGSG